MGLNCSLMNLVCMIRNVSQTLMTSSIVFSVLLIDTLLLSLHRCLLLTNIFLFALSHCVSELRMLVRDLDLSL